MLIRALLMLVMLAVGNSPAGGGNHKPKLPPAGEPDDQALVIGGGKSHNSKDSTVFQMKYLHKVFQHVGFSLTAEYTEVTDRADLLAGLQIYPIKPKVYFTLGGGASKGPDNESTLVIKTGVGYEIDFHELWYVDLHGGKDWESGIQARWTLLLGLGKRF